MRRRWFYRLRSGFPVIEPSSNITVLHARLPTWRASSFRSYSAESISRHKDNDNRPKGDSDASMDTASSETSSMNVVHRDGSKPSSSQRTREDFPAFLSEISEALLQSSNIPSSTTPDQQQSRPSDFVADADARLTQPTVSSRLPQSPLLSPSLINARSRYNTAQLPPKKVPKQLSPPSLRLQDNPWAQILASPVRLCQATKVRLPSALLSDWKLFALPKSAEAEAEAEAADKQENHSPNETATETPYLLPADLADFSVSNPGEHGRSIRLAPTYPIIHYLTHQASRLAKLIPPHWRQGGYVRPPKGQKMFDWHGDMPELYGRLLRRKVVSELVSISNCGNEAKEEEVLLVRGDESMLSRPSPLSPTLLPSVDVGRESEQVNMNKTATPNTKTVAYLWIGEHGKGGTDPDMNKLMEQQQQQSDANNQGNIPAFNLPHLLGPEAMSSLRSQLPDIFNPISNSDPAQQEKGRREERREERRSSKREDWIAVKTPVLPTTTTTTTTTTNHHSNIKEPPPSPSVNRIRRLDRQRRLKKNNLVMDAIKWIWKLQMWEWSVVG